MALDYGGDDVSELYLRLLERINLPYKERINVDMARTWEWRMMEDLKGRSASLAEVSPERLFLFLPLVLCLGMLIESVYI